MKFQGIERLGGLRYAEQTNNPVEALVKARRLLSDRRRWIKHQYTLRGDSGLPVAFCAIGACNRYSKAYEPQRYLTVAAGQPVIDVNDNPKTGHARILAIFDKAIRLAKEDK